MTRLHPTRRNLLRAGISGALGAGLLGSGGLSKLLAARRAQAADRQPSRSDVPGFGQAKSCILVYLQGGPSHIDMWDMKPDAPAEIRGPFKPIATSLPGLQVCEHLPLLAQRAHRYTLVRSVTHPNDLHVDMVYYTLTGKELGKPEANDAMPTDPSRTDHPHIGSIVSRYKPNQLPLPGFVAIPGLTLRMMAPISPGSNAGFMGSKFDPLAINEDPRDAGYLPAMNLPDQFSEERFAARQDLLAIINGSSPRHASVDEYEAQKNVVARLLGTRATKAMFDLARETEAVRDLYGSSRFGQSLLLARRLVEQGIPFVAIHFNRMTQCDGWDTHKNNFQDLHDELLPLLDEGLSALLDDLTERGLLDETLVIAMGEFGRTPRINKDAGRDHWGRCGSVILAGGGIRTGQVLGASDNIGAYPTQLPIDPTDLHATMYHLLGIDFNQTLVDPLNRPFPICSGKVVRELL